MYKDISLERGNRSSRTMRLAFSFRLYFAVIRSPFLVRSRNDTLYKTDQRKSRARWITGHAVSQISQGHSTKNLQADRGLKIL